MVRHAQLHPLHPTVHERRRTLSKSLKGRAEHQRRAPPPPYSWESPALSVHDPQNREPDLKRDRLSILAQRCPSTWSLDIQMPYLGVHKRGKRAGKSTRSKVASTKQIDLLGELGDGICGLEIRDEQSLDNFTPAPKPDFRAPQSNFTFSGEGLKSLRRHNVTTTLESTKSGSKMTDEHVQVMPPGLWQNGSKRGADMTASVEMPSRKRNEPRFFPISPFVTLPGQAMTPKQPGTHSPTAKLAAAHIAAMSAAFHAHRLQNPIPNPSKMTFGTHCTPTPPTVPPVDQSESEDLEAVIAADKQHILQEAFEPFLPDGQGGIYRASYSPPDEQTVNSPVNSDSKADSTATTDTWRVYQSPEDHAQELHFDDLFATLSPQSSSSSIIGEGIPSLVQEEDGEEDLSESWCNISDIGSDVDEFEVGLLEYDGDDEWVKCE